MKEVMAYDDAVDLLDADHKAVKKKFIDYNAMCEDGVPAAARKKLAEEICQALTVHTRLEEELFYPAVRKATGDDALMDTALDEHSEAKKVIAQIQSMSASSEDLDKTVKTLAKLIDEHVLEEREQMFLEARYAHMDLRSLAATMYARKKKLTAAVVKAAKSGKAGKSSEPKVKATQTAKSGKELT